MTQIGKVWEGKLYTQRVVPNQEQPEGTTSKNRLRSHVDPRPYTTRSTYIAHTNTFLTLLSISHSLLIHRLGSLKRLNQRVMGRGLSSPFEFDSVVVLALHSMSRQRPP